MTHSVVPALARYDRDSGSEAERHVLHLFQTGGHAFSVCSPNNRSHGITYGKAPGKECNELPQGCASDACNWPTLAAGAGANSWLAVIGML